MMSKGYGDGIKFQIDRHRELMRVKKRARDRERRRQETVEMRKKVLSGELKIHPEAVRAKKRRQARNKQRDTRKTISTWGVKDLSLPPARRNEITIIPALSRIASKQDQDEKRDKAPLREGNNHHEEASVASILVGLFSKPSTTTSNEPIIPLYTSSPTAVQQQNRQMPPPRFDIEKKINL